MALMSYQQSAVPPCEVGDRIEFRRSVEPCPIREGEHGTVLEVKKHRIAGQEPQWHVRARWDCGRVMAVTTPADVIRRLPA